VAALSARFYESIGAKRWPGGVERSFLRIDQCWAPLSGTQRYPVFSSASYW